MHMDDKQFQELKDKLDIIAKLLAINFVKEKSGQKDQILALSSFGFTNSQIAEFLGTTASIVRATLSRERKKEKKRSQR
jgi:DNA-binding NarL/FixJ family response regulator